MKLHNIKQGTDEWLKLRLGKLTASSAQAIASNGKGLETLVYEKVAELLTHKLPEQFENEHIKRGNELEPLARNSYELETGNVVKEVGFVELDQYTGASPDGLVGDDGLVEFKCPSDIVFLKAMHTKKIDTKYVW
jgi:predicted phage-related endonuclease